VIYPGNSDQHGEPPHFKIDKKTSIIKTTEYLADTGYGLYSFQVDSPLTEGIICLDNTLLIHGPVDQQAIKGIPVMKGMIVFGVDDPLIKVDRIVQAGLHLAVLLLRPPPLFKSAYFCYT
jgi:hypothetical protein